MSRTATTGTAPTKAAPQATTTSSVPMEKVAMLAYQKWLKAGCKHGSDKQHWLEAEAELKAQMGTMRK
jgi:hypothetical protein